jgi:hypothetical protein
MAFYCFCNIGFSTDVFIFKHNQKYATLHNGIYHYNCSTCFRRFLRPSSGAQKLYTQHRVYVRLLFQLTHASGKKHKKPDIYPMLCIQFLSPWWWAEEPPETCRAFIVTNTIVKCCILLVMLEYINDAWSHERKTDVFVCVNLSHFTELHFLYRQKIIPLLLGTYCKNFLHIRSNDTRFRL